MKRFVAFAFLAFAGCPSSGTPPPPMSHHPVGAAPMIHGTVKIAAADRCGGAAPPPEYKPPQPQPAVNEKVIVRAGRENSDSAPVLELATNSDGVFEAPLPDGTYCVVLADKRSAPGGAKPEQHTDESCLANYFKTCDAIAEIPGGAPADITRSTPCFGVCYNGPMPP
ncbi:MAG TPA: hypothetical protein VL463_02230 [Kofleriaceae bacterium]|nr:hypothetical protein [Kofleriaceae bacterium]